MCCNVNKIMHKFPTFNNHTTIVAQNENSVWEGEGGGRQIAKSKTMHRTRVNYVFTSLHYIHSKWEKTANAYARFMLEIIH